jgi:hypothetical protein
MTKKLTSTNREAGTERRNAKRGVIRREDDDRPVWSRCARPEYKTRLIFVSQFIFLTLTDTESVATGSGCGFQFQRGLTIQIRLQIMDEDEATMYGRVYPISDRLACSERPQPRGAFERFVFWSFRDSI